MVEVTQVSESNPNKVVAVVGGNKWYFTPMITSVNGVAPDYTGAIKVDLSPQATTLNVVGQSRGDTEIKILSADSEITKSGSGDNITYSFSPYPKVRWSMTHAVGTYAEVIGSNPMELSKENTITIGESESTINDGEIVNDLRLFNSSVSIAKYYDTTNKTLTQDAITFLRSVKIGNCPKLFFNTSGSDHACNLISTDFSFLDVSECTNASYLYQLGVANFQESDNITYTLSGKEFPKCTSVKHMFTPSWVTYNAWWAVTNLTFQILTDCSYMFDSTHLAEVSGLNIPNITNMDHMFYNSYKTTRIDLSTLNTKSVTNMSSTFYYVGKSSGCTITCPQGLDLSSVTKIHDMFYAAKFTQPIHLKNVPTKFIASGSSSDDWTLISDAKGTRGTHYIIDSVKS